MFTVDEATASAILAAFARGGELLAIAELRQHYRGIPDNERARVCLHILLSWSKPSTDHGGSTAAPHGKATRKDVRAHRQPGASEAL